MRYAQMMCRLCRQLKNRGESFCFLNFFKNLATGGEKTVAYFRFENWNEAVDGKEQYLKMELQKGR